MTDNLVKDIKKNVRQRIDAGEVDGDINWWMLALLSDLHDKREEDSERLEEIENNPVVNMGVFIKNRPLISWALAQVVSLVLVGTSLAIALGLIDKLGLAVVIKP